MRNKGCAIASAGMVLRAYGIDTDPDGKPVDPGTLNKFLRTQPGGFLNDGNMSWREVLEFGTLSGGTLDLKIFTDEYDVNVLNEELCNGNPVILQVDGPNGTHFVVVDGQTVVNGVNTHTIKDPGYAETTLLAYGNTAKSMRIYRPEEDPGYLIFVVTGDADFLITDPLGRQEGLDPDTGGSVFGIPNATFGSDSVGDDDPQNGGFPTNPSLSFDTVEPLVGVYQIDLHGLSGTEFRLEIVSYATAGGVNDIRHEVGTIEAGKVITFTYNYRGDLAVEANFEVGELETIAALNGFEIEGTFTLGEGNNGIDLLTESVTLSIDTLHLTTPAGSFELVAGTFEFEGEIRGVELEIEITPLGNDSFAFDADGEDANLSELVNPVDVQLTIGDDFAKTSVIGDLD